MKSSFTNCANVALLLMACSAPVSAALFPSLDGKAYYDDVLDITWLADTGYAKTSGDHPTGWMSWADANAWATSLAIDGVTGWRLPGMIDIDHDGCTQFKTKGGSDCGYNVLTGSAATTVYSELASLWYDTLGNLSSYDRFGHYGAYDASGNWVGGLRNTGPFVNLKPGGHWTNQRYEGRTWGPNFGGNSWFFSINNGLQSSADVTDELRAWAVHPGDLRLVVGATLNGMETATAPGPSFPVSGSSASWNYRVKNTSGQSIFDVRLYAESVEPERVDPEELCYLDMIPAGGEATCTSESLIVDGAVKIRLSAQGSSQEGNHVQSDMAAWYIGGSDFKPSLFLDVTMAGLDIDSQRPGPELYDRGTWYHNVSVTNTGVVPLRNVRVFDRTEEPSTEAWTKVCVFSAIEPTETKTCQVDVKGIEGGDIMKRHFTAQMRYQNGKITDSDFSYYRILDYP